MTRMLSKYGSEFEIFVTEELELADTDFTKNDKGEYVDTFTKCLQILWEKGWESGYDYGYDNGLRDERIEHRNQTFRGQYV
jgi:hypothetical protein